MLRLPLNFPGFLFTGVPGIGKSIFLIYFLCRYIIDDRFLDKRFALEFQVNKYFYFKPTEVAGEYISTRVAANQFPIRDVVLLADIYEIEEPYTRGKWTLLSSSPNPLRYKEFVKFSPVFKVTVPTWSEEELRIVAPNITEWFDRFIKCGGVIRNVLWNGMGDNPIALIHEALEERGADISGYYFNYGFGGKVLDKNYTLIHINPISSEGNYQYFHRPIETFASEYVYNKIASFHEKHLVVEDEAFFHDAGDIRLRRFGSV